MPPSRSFSGVGASRCRARRPPCIGSSDPALAPSQFAGRVTPQVGSELRRIRGRAVVRRPGVPRLMSPGLLLVFERGGALHAPIGVPPQTKVPPAATQRLTRSVVVERTSAGNMPVIATMIVRCAERTSRRALANPFASMRATCPWYRCSFSSASRWSKMPLAVRWSVPRTGYASSMYTAMFFGRVSVTGTATILRRSVRDRRLPAR